MFSKYQNHVENFAAIDINSNLKFYQLNSLLVEKQKGLSLTEISWYLNPFVSQPLIYCLNLYKPPSSDEKQKGVSLPKISWSLDPFASQPSIYCLQLFKPLSSVEKQKGLSLR